MIKRSEYIVVDSISSVDPNALSVDQLNQKFIDKQGNRFALRFNRNTRRAEFVRITLESHAKGTTQIHNHKPSSPVQVKQSSKPLSPGLGKITLQEIIAKTQQPSVKIPKPNESPINEAAVQQSIFQEPAWDQSKAKDNTTLDLGRMDLNIMEHSTPSASSSSYRESKDSSFKIEFGSSSPGETNIIEKRISDLTKIKERIHSVLNNLQNSKIFEITGDPSENKNIIGNLNREFDIEFFQKLDKILNYHKELTTYPRSVNYYTAKYESSRKQLLQSKTLDSEKLKLVTLWEMQEMMLGLIQKLKKMVLNTLNVLNTKNDNHIKQLAYNQQQMFRDSRTALLYCSEDISSLLISLERWVDTE
ncbi:LIC_10450 family protein [Leptospira adleri]|uniref:Uncharacterized protein n=1 Tax=Leptospira adleri TaxID=2023186 RepID=A0A2M9YQ52_9LEPT|nr:hypothetical protein [Leptospira adleri]PJZ53666.1 hypothetical protein CH380_08730 [Leptospira adleri]PJZ61199.1 hypothetical protein CH376_14340 [Leptospira adleri]